MSRKSDVKREESEKIAFEMQLGFWLVVLVNKIAQEVKATWLATMEQLDLQIFQEDLRAILGKSYDIVAQRVIRAQINWWEAQLDDAIDQSELPQAVYGQHKDQIVLNSNFILITLQKILTKIFARIDNINKVVSDFKSEAGIHVKGIVANTQVQQTYESVKLIVASYVLARYTQSDIGNITKTWEAIIDERTREWHREANGQTVGFDSLFEVGPDLMDHPGDPTASVANTANCRCSLFFNLQRS